MSLEGQTMSTLSANPTPERPFLTPQEVSDLLHVSVQTVRRWIKDEKLPAYKVGPRMWRIRAADLDKWLQRSAAASSESESHHYVITSSHTQPNAHAGISSEEDFEP